MNGKHPIDERFARTMRDAEATPPDAVWKGVAAALDRAPTARRTGAAWWFRGGAAALLLLLLGVAVYWLASPRTEKQARPAEHGATRPTAAIDAPPTDPVPAGAPSQQQEVPPPANNRGAEANDLEERVPAPATGQRSDDRRAAATASATPLRRPPVPRHAEDGMKGTPGTSAPRPADPVEAVIHGVVPEAPNAGGLANGEQPSAEPAAVIPSIGAPDSAGPHGAAPAISTAIEVPEPFRPRTSSDIHLPLMAGRTTPFANKEPPPPGPLLQGDSTPVYVLSKGRWWFAVQAEAAKLTGQWKGPATEVPDLNAAESWLGGQGLSLVVGREWLNGWSAGLGIGAVRQRSRFLRYENEPGQTQTVIDTTWTASYVGQQANYTWDIVETEQTEPGQERVFRATNEYLWLRIAPEAGRHLAGQRRLSLYARAGAAVLFGIGRKGSSLYEPGITTDDAPPGGHVRVVPLDDAAVRDRFALSFAAWGALELRYQLCERWSVGALPMIAWRPAIQHDGGPGLSLTEFSGALRLCYHLPHQELRTR